MRLAALATHLTWPHKLCAELTLCLLLLAGRASAQDRFEIQVYDSETAGVLERGLETHINYSVEGTRQPSSSGEAPTRHQARITFEPHLGVTPWSEIGGYFQTVLQPDGTLNYAGVKLRYKMKLLQKIGNWLGLALNTELSSVPRAYEANRWGSELRPIADAHWDRLYASINPIISIDLAGELVGRPQFQPAVKLGVDVLPGLQVGGECYMGLGPIFGGVGNSEHAHTLYGVLDYSSDYLDLNFGVGRGFAAADRWVIKAIIGIHPKARIREQNQ